MKKKARSEKKNRAKILWADKKNLWLLLCLLILLLIHLPFIKSDPDTLVDINTRGAWTDEGLYSGQIRNYINHGEFDIEENNQFIVTPLFSALLYPFYLLSGDGVVTGRLVVIGFLLICLCVCFIKQEFRLTGMFFIPVVFAQYQVFHFSHYNMAEMVCVGWIILAFAAVNHFFVSSKKSYFPVIFSALFLFCAYSTKIQFLGVAAVLPLTLFFYALLNGEGKHQKINIRFKPFLVSLLVTVLLALLYFAAWYLPEKEFYNKVMTYETADRIPENIGHLLQLIKFHWGFTFWKKELIPLILFAAGAFITIPYILVSKERKNYLGSFLFLLFWILIEFSKVSASYLPYRYLLGLIVSVGLLASFSLSFVAQKGRFFFTLSTLAVVVVAACNLYLIYGSYNRRSYDIAAVNNYLKPYDLKNTNVLGVWSHTLARDTKSKVVTCRRGYLNDVDPVKKFHPKLVISEFNEADSDSVFYKQGIDLAAISDSVREFDVWRYKIRLYWIKQSGEIN